MIKHLKTCPFCGGIATYYRAEITIKGKSTDSVTVKCSNCKSRSKRFLFDKDSLRSQNDAYKQASSLWNNRPIEKTLDEVREVGAYYMDEYQRLRKQLNDKNEGE